MHDHNHEHSHYHIHTKERSTRIVVMISFVTMVLEIYVGYVVNSKTLMMEGWHMLSHVLVLALAWMAYMYIKQKHNEITHARQERVISLSGFAGAVVMLLITFGMIYNSVSPFFTHEPHEVDVTTEAVIVAIIGLIVNAISAYFLHREEEKTDVNLQAAYLHVVSDIIISLFALASFIFIKLFNWAELDSIFALISALIILRWSIGLIRKSWKEVLR